MWHILRTEGPRQLKNRIVRKISYKPAPENLPLLTSLPRYDPDRPPKFNLPEIPDISIIIPVYNQLDFTLNCLNSICFAGADRSFEIIVIDDASMDDTPRMIPRIPGVVYHRNRRNSGFIESCNAGAAAAKGRYLIFLNNDTLVTRDWLDELAGTFTARSDAGLVGAKLVYPDGTLQEAGGLVWRDGSAWNYGIHENPNDPKFNYLRQCDYCSGACLMIEKSFFETIGGFDPHYAPAYYEDTDLAFRVRQHGKKVYYQPMSLVYHFEGATSGKSLSAGIKRHQLANQKKFYRRWRTALQRHRPNGVAPEIEKERAVAGRVLILDASMLTPDMDSGSLRMFNLIRILQRRNYKVTFLPDNLWYLENYVKMLQVMGVEVLYAPYVASAADHIETFGGQYDVVMLSRADVAHKYIELAKAHTRKDAVVIFDTVDLHFLREQRQAELEKNMTLKRRAQWRRKQELGIMQRADMTLVVSPVEQETLKKIDPQLRIEVVSNIHATARRKNGFRQRDGLLFLGAFDHLPNVDAAIYFTTTIFPLIKSVLTSVKLFIVGSNPSDAVCRLAADDVKVTGYVKDISFFLDKSKVAVAPLRFGSGVKGKINSYMGAGLPVVATSVAAEGMFLEDNVNAMIADDPQEFAGKVIRLHRDEDLWQRISDGGLANIADHFSFAAAEKGLWAALRFKSSGP